MPSSVPAELRKVLSRSTSRNSKGCAFLKCSINYGPYFSNSEVSFVLLPWIVQIQVECTLFLVMCIQFLFLIFGTETESR